MVKDEFIYQKKGPESILRAFLHVLEGILAKKGFQKTFERLDPEGSDSYVFEKNNNMVSVTLNQRGPETAEITITSGVPMTETITEAVDALIEGIRIILKPAV
jgi:hypothetical protein